MAEQVRDRVCNLKFASEDIARWDEWAQDRGFTRTTLIETAIERMIDDPAAPVKPVAKATHQPKVGQRRAFICNHETKGVRDCNRRTFLTPDEPDRVPDCAEHGPMQPQPNRPYMGQPTT